MYEKLSETIGNMGIIGAAPLTSSENLAVAPPEKEGEHVNKNQYVIAHLQAG